MPKTISKEIDLGGRKLKLETGKLAILADSAVVASWGESVVLVTVVTKPLLEPIGYFPLSVEYVEKYYAGGKITAQKFIKRETRPSDKAICAGRAIDRSIRPLFPKDFPNEVQVIITVLSFDGENDPALLGLIGTSAALTISSIPWAGPIGATRLVERENSAENFNLDLLVTSTSEKVVMIEAEGNQVPDEIVLTGIKEAYQHCQPIIDLIDEFAKEVGREKVPYKVVTEGIDQSILNEVKKVAKEKIKAALFDKEHTWHEATGDMIKAELAAEFAERLDGQSIGIIFDHVAKELMNDLVLNQGKRVDGRGFDEIRPIEMEVGILPRTHGSALFKRGDTQVLSVVTLGPPSAAQTLEGMEGESRKRFMYHYNMSINPFATGEVKRISSPSRRDIGHGNLVEKGLGYLLPSEEKFPYAIRVVSEVLAANASTSMASLCASTLALLNAGVAIEPVAGVALGLLSDNDKFQVITDMRAVEDFYGEMDFKVAGTIKGVTAIQMDTKLAGISFEIIKEALDQGQKARKRVLEHINQVIPAVQEISIYAPKVALTHIKPEEIGTLIGPGGKNINSIIAKTSAQIDIEDDGTVMVSSTNEESIKKALEAIKEMFATFEVGQEFDGKVVRIVPFGAFVEIAPGKDGLVHVSQMASGRVGKPEDVVSEGQMVHVQVTNIDTQGKVGLSMLFGEDRKASSESRPRFDRDRGRFRGRFPPSRGRR